MAQQHSFWDRIAARYAARPVGDQAAYEVKLEKTRACLTPESRVLEIGCGTGSTAIVHAPRVTSYLATDFSGEMIAIARTKAAAAGVTNLRFEQRDVSQIGPQDGVFDVVMGHSLLHLLRDWRAVSTNVFDILVPGGLFITSTSCIREFTPLIRPLLGFGRWIGKVPALAIFSKEELQQGLRDAGFILEEVWQPKPRAAVFIIARKPD